MLAAPAKKAKSVDFEGPLSALLVESGHLSIHQSSIEKLNSARERAVAAAAAPAADAVERTETYLLLLGDLESTFGSDESSMEIKFTYTDALKPKKSAAHHSFAFERHCTLFNLAAQHSHVGMAADRATPEGLKISLAHFQAAAGVFEHLRVCDKPAGASTCDFSPEALSMLTHLMLAQAQACYYTKAATSKHSPGVLSKLAHQASVWYGVAWEASTSPIIAATLEKSWSSMLAFQKKAFAGYAHFRAGLAKRISAEESGVGYGEHLAHLYAAERELNDALEQASAKNAGIPPALSTPLRDVRAEVRAAIAKGTSDNDSIYMESVPGAPSSALTGHPLAKAIPPAAELLRFVPRRNGGMQKQVSGIFQSLVPPIMQEAEAIYQSRISALQRKWTDEAASAVDRLRNGLADAGLPASVESGGGKDSRGIPDATWDRIVAHVQSRNGLGGLKQDFKESCQSSTNLNAMLRECVRTLDEQATADNDAVRRDEGMREEAARFDALLKEAAAADAILASRIAAAEESIALVCGSRASLAAVVPSADDADDDDQVEAARSTLALMLVDLGTKVKEVEGLSSLLVDSVRADTLVDRLREVDSHKLRVLLEDAPKLETIMDDAARKHEAYTSQLFSKIENLVPSFQRVLNVNHAYAASRKVTPSIIAREAALAKIDCAVDLYDSLCGGVLQSSRFYADLTARMVNFQEQVRDHAMVRKMDREERAVVVGEVVSEAPPPKYHPSNTPAARFREALGLDRAALSDERLATLLANANNDVNAAIDTYLS